MSRLLAIGMVCLDTSYSTKSRTRLYRIGLTNNLAEIIEDFDLYGLRESEWQEFAKGVEYEAFLVKRRSKADEKN